MILIILYVLCISVGAVCDSVVCMNGGTCVEADGSCQCTADYTGRNCENLLSECIMHTHTLILIHTHTVCILYTLYNTHIQCYDYDMYIRTYVCMYVHCIYYIICIHIMYNKHIEII